MSDSPPATAAPAYRVLARKYRPQRFSELIGQEAMVQTLGNAIKRNKIAHAFIMTGVRGVGKTSTARLIAKALNCIGTDGQGCATIDPCGACEPCVAIAEGRHIDVVEMDAASHTGVDDVREIIEAVRYSSVSARYKVYIIDEVHMLSKNAFNALLKTLEEPPPHVKFIFATTEIDKVPVTVLSRCQRFDLRRIPADTLAAHFARVVDAEQVQAEPEALALIARAADGSVRDGLSILDQAIAHADSESAGLVTAPLLRDILGLADKGSIRRLFDLILAGDAQPLLAAVAEAHRLGVEPLSLVRGLLEACHAITIAKVGGHDDVALSAEEREGNAAAARSLSFAVLHRLWQMLLKGYDEVARAVESVQALDMALLRMVYAASMPDPEDLLRKLESGQGMSITASAPLIVATGAASGSSSHLPADFQTMLTVLEQAGKRQLALILHDTARVVRYAPPELVINPSRPLPAEFPRDVAAALKAATGEAWQVSLSLETGAASLLEQRQAAEKDAQAALLAHPLIKAAFAAFPDAEYIKQNRS